MGGTNAIRNHTGNRGGLFFLIFTPSGGFFFLPPCQGFFNFYPFRGVFIFTPAAQFLAPSRTISGTLIRRIDPHYNTTYRKTHSQTLLYLKKNTNVMVKQYSLLCFFNNTIQLIVNILFNSNCT